MKSNNWLPIVLLISIIAIVSACGGNDVDEQEVAVAVALTQTAVPQPATQTDPAATVPPPIVMEETAVSPIPEAAAPEVAIILEANPQNEALTDISVHNVDTGKELLFLTLENIRINHYHPSEYRDGNLYILQRIGDDTGENWVDELWKYDAQGAGEKIFSAQGLDFRAAPDESAIAITYALPSDSVDYLLVVINPQGDVLQEFPFDQIDPQLIVSLEKWADDSRYFWIAFNWTTARPAYAKIENGSWQTQDYDTSDVGGHPAETDLNPNTGQLVYSDMPAFFDVDSLEAFTASQELVTLFVYDFDSQTTTVIVESAAQSFEPIWLGDDLIEYNDPQGDGRTLHNLTANSTATLPSDPTGTTAAANLQGITS